MFKGLGNLGDLAGLMKEAGKIKQRMEELKGRLGDMIAEGTAGGGMVKVRANARQEILSIEIEDEAFAGGDRTMVQDLVTAAANAALDNSRELVRQEIAGITGGLPLDIPGIM